jgi:hypothetical protein
MANLTLFVSIQDRREPVLDEGAVVMKNSFATVCACAFLLILAAAGSVFAIENKPPSVTPAKPTKMSPSALTAAECKGLGGKVAPSVNKCDSGAMCLTTDKDGVVHSVCLTKQ